MGKLTACVVTDRIRRIIVVRSSEFKCRLSSLLAARNAVRQP